MSRWLNISATFDTINIDKLLMQSESVFLVCGLETAWIRSDITGRSCYVTIGDLRSDVWSCDSGIPQGSVLGPVLFSAFVSPISRIMESQGIRFHQYADDTQLYTEIRSPAPSQMEALSQCVSALTFRFLDNWLQLNSTKSEAMILGSRQGLSKLKPVASLDIGDGHVEVRDGIKILGVHLDPTLSMNVQVIEVVDEDLRLPHSCSPTCSPRSDFRICRAPSVSSLLDSIIVTHTCMALQKANIGRLQRVQNDLPRVVLQAAWNSSSKPLLKHLHWLPVQQRIIFNREARRLSSSWAN